MTGERAPSRHVVLDGAVNVRDIGGYRSVQGLEVTRGRLFRGDTLSQLSSGDVDRLDRLGLRTVIDFRSPGEVLLGGDDRLAYGVEFAHLPVSGGDLGDLYELIASGDHERQRRELGEGRAASFMAEMNRGFVTDARQREAFGAALRLICAPGRLPLLYHCTAGKDRAGWMTAIGVPRELVHAIIQQESNWNDRAVSGKGARGLMQLMPNTASGLGVRDAFDMKDNIGGGVRYLRNLLTQYHGDMRLAVAAYYAGEHRVHGLQYSNEQVIRYVEQVRRRYLKELSLQTSPKESQP